VTAATLADDCPDETSLDRAPGLLEGARTLTLTAQGSGLEHWLHAVAQGTLRGLVDGHRPDVRTPGWMREDGPLRQALLEEFAFRSVAEEKATRALSYLVQCAPDTATLEFFTTQLVDEARHAAVFRSHLLELGVAQDELAATVARVSQTDVDRVLVPLEEFGLPLGRDGDFVGGVVVLTVLVEGVLAPAAELSERKWRLLDPAAAQVERAAGIDEIRHLTVGSSVVREHLLQHPEERSRVADLVARGQRLWSELPVLDVVLRRERLFSEGLAQLSHVVGDYAVWDGRRLVDTTAEERLVTAATWSAQMQAERLAHMGLA
jgi:hypothetical protein